MQPKAARTNGASAIGTSSTEFGLHRPYTRNNEQNDSNMGKLMILLYFILSVFPADATENRRHIHVVRRGSKKSHRGDTVAKIWIEENGQKKIEVAWSELSADEEALIMKAIDEHWEELNQLIDAVFAGKKIQIKRIK